MGKILIMVSAVVICAPWLLRSTGNCEEKKTPVEKAYSLIDLPDSGKIIGLSPNAASVIIGYESSCRIESICLENGTIAGKMWSSDLDNVRKYPYGKRAVWSQDGKLLTFRSNGVYPLELSRLRNFCIYAIDAASGKIIEVGDDNCSEKPRLPSIKMTYDAALVPGMESLLYHRYAATGVELYIAGLGGGKSVKFRQVGGDGAFAYAVPLSGTAALVYVEPMRNRDPITLTIFSADHVDRDVMRNDRNGKIIVWEMKASSADGRVILIQERRHEPQTGNMVISALKILRLNNDWSDWNIDSIVKREGLTIMDSALSPDGKKLIYLQRTNAAKGDAVSIFCRVREGSFERPVFEEKPKSIDDWAPKRNGEGIIYMSDRAFILRVGEQYRFYGLGLLNLSSSPD